MNPENLFALTWQVGLIACCSSAILAAAVLSIWGMFDAAGLTNTQKSSLKRGVKISAQPLTPEQRDFLRGMQGDLNEAGKTSWEVPSFIRKRGSEVLIYVSDSRIRRFRRLAYVGYVNLNAPQPVLEFRSSLPYHLLLFIPLLFVFPLAIAAFAINFSAEKQAIEAFLREAIGKNQSIEPA
ncbi:MAG: hypothetical protein N2117_06400 [Anaerolineales bacterium]|nr:hypothetical protein [Anaerolineales bacterium]